MRTNSLDVTVHELVYEPGEQPRSSPQAAVESAASLVDALRDESIWRPPRKVDFSIFSFRQKCFQFASDPPSCRPISEGEATHIPPAKDWNAPMDPEEDEMRLVDVLEDFDHSTLHEYLARERVRDVRLPTSATGYGDAPTAYGTTGVEAQPQSRGLDKRGGSAECCGSRPWKRPRLDEGPLHGALPRPHLYPSPMTSEDPWPAFTPSEFFTARTTPIPPHTDRDVEVRVQDPLCRLAWVVPVRGRLPWEGATSASIMGGPRESVDGSEPPELQGHIPEGPHTTTLPPEIIWTRDALQQFWDFLRSVREVGNLGPLSLAFHNPPPQSAVYTMDRDSYFGSHGQEVTLGLSSLSADSLSGRHETAPSIPLRQSDYIKIYHDARYAKNLRNILNAWSYKKEGVKVRLLKGATLALLDERGKGLLLC